MESGAQLSSVAAAADSNLPSIFEVVAQESLMTTLKPALHHVLRIAAERNPQYFGRLLAHYDELYVAVHLLLESYYLRHYDASFSENFYGLRRARCEHATSAVDDTQSVVDKVQHLTRSDRRRSLFFLVAMPYIKSKLDQWYDHLSESRRHISHQHGRLFRAFLAAYPLLHALWEGSVLYFQLAFMFGRSQCHSPLLYLSNLVLRHLTDEEITASRSASLLLQIALTGKSWPRRVLIIIGKLLSYVSLILSMSLSTGLFFLQFLQWWYSNDEHASTMTSLPNPGPPPKHVTAPSGECRLTNVCPLCNRLRVNDTVLSVSGFVFCYQCIFKFVRDKACCPITGYPANSSHLIRIYQSDDL